MTRGRIAAVVLAAGTSSRFGSTKQLAPLSGQPLLRATLASLADDVVDDVVVVVGHDAGRVERALEGTSVRVVRNERYREGMGTSIAAGIVALAEHTDAVLIALGDQPVLAGVVRALVERWRAYGDAMVAPSYRGTRGHPVLFDASLFAELRTLEGDRGARDLIAADRTRVALLELDAAAPRDVDTPADLRALEAGD